MALVTNNAEGGTNATTVTTGNSGGGSGTALTVAIGSGAALTYDNAVTAHGTLSYEMVPASGTTTTMIWSIAASQIAVRFYVYFDTLPGAAIRICDIRNSGGTILRVQTTATNTIQIQEGGTGTPVHMTTATLSAATWYRFEIVISSIAAGTGAYTCDYYLLDQVTSLQGVNITNGQLGTTNVAFVEFGSIASSTATTAVHFDDLAYNDGAATYIGPVQSAIVEIFRRIRPRPQVPPRHARSSMHVPGQVALPSATRRVARRPAPARRRVQRAIPLTTTIVAPAFVRVAVGRKVRWIATKIKRFSSFPWPQTIPVIPPEFEWEGEWLIGIADTEWIVGNPDIDPSGPR